MFLLERYFHDLNRIIMFKNNKGFTLIEMLVVVGVVALILPAVFAMIFSILRQQSKLYALQEIKRQGDFVLNNIRTNLKNSAVTVHTATPPTDSNLICNLASAPSTVPLFFKDRFNNYFSYALSGDLIASNSSVPSATTSLTNNRVKVVALSISCSRNATFSPPIVSISYTVQYNTNSTRPEDTASFTYQTKMQLKSY